MKLRPIGDRLLLADDQMERVEGGVIVRRRVGCPHMDFVVVAAGRGAKRIGVGDRVVLKDPNAGRRFMLDGVVYRQVRERDAIALCVQGE